MAGLFAGVGGLEWGLEKAGHSTEYLCEVDAAAQAVLRARFRGAEVVGDIRAVESLPRGIDLVTAGFPCQDLSSVGEARGIRGAKSSLVGHVFRLLAVTDVPMVLLENVPFMLHLQRGRAMAHVTQELEELGYRWAYRVVDAMAFGLPQRRRRVFLLAARDEDPASVLFGQDAVAPRGRDWDPKLPVGFYWTEGNRGVGWAVDAVPTLKGGSGWGIPSPPAVLLPDGRVVKPGIRAAEQLQGLPADWTEPALQAEGVRPQDRWRLVGNAVCADVAEWIGGHLAAPKTSDPTIVGEKIGQGRWPDAACSSDAGPRAVKCGDWPVSRKLQSIVSFVGSDASSLSVRATDGFVGRVVRAVRTGKLRVPEQFVERLRQHSLRVAREAAACGPKRRSAGRRSSV